LLWNIRWKTSIRRVKRVHQPRYAADPAEASRRSSPHTIPVTRRLSSPGCTRTSRRRAAESTFGSQTAEYDGGVFTQVRLNLSSCVSSSNFLLCAGLWNSLIRVPKLIHY
jgi:hypothetical protein